jgi:hypothetical protein
MNAPLTMTAEEWQRGRLIDDHYVEFVPCTDDEVLEWQHARLDVVADGLPGVEGIGPLKAAAFALAKQREVNSDELVYDESAFRLFVRGWLASRGILTTDEPPEADA